MLVRFFFFLLTSFNWFNGFASATLIRRTPSSAGKSITLSDRSMCSCGFDSFSSSMAYSSSWNVHWSGKWVMFGLEMETGWRRYLLDSCTACRMHGVWSSKRFRRQTISWSQGTGRLFRRRIRANRPNRTTPRVCIEWLARSSIQYSRRCPMVSMDRWSCGNELILNKWNLRHYFHSLFWEPTFCSISQCRRRCWCNSAHIWRNPSHS